MKIGLKIVYRIILVVLGIYGLFLNFSSSIINWVDLLHYFTITSNILVVLLFIILLFKTDFKWYSTIKGAVTMSITVTFLIFHFMLKPTMFTMIGTSYSPYSPANLLIHYIVPLMAIFDWILFDKKGKYTAKNPFYNLIIPYSYFIISTICGLLGYTFSTGSHYPYFFIDFDAIGLFGVMKYLLIITVFFVFLGYVFYFIDLFLGKNKKCK